MRSFARGAALSVVALFAAVVPAMAAQSPGATPSPSPSPAPLRVIESVKVTGASASRQEQFKSSFSGSVLDRADIRELGPQESMQSILSSKPSVQVFGFGGSPYVRSHFSFRGFTGGQFGETMDGIPLNGLFNGGVSNSASQRNATPFVTSLLNSVNIYRGVNDPQHTSIDSLGGSVAYHLIDPTNTPSTRLTYNVGLGGDAFIQTGPTALFGTKFAIGLGSDYYRGFQSDVPDSNRYVYINGVVPLKGHNFLRLIYSRDQNVGYVPHDVPIDNIPTAGYPPYSLQNSGIGFQWPASQTYSFNTANVSLAIVDFAHEFSPRFTTRLTFFRYDTSYHRMSYTNANDFYLPNSPFAPTFAQPYMNGTISSNPADFAFHLYRNGDQRNGYVFRGVYNTSPENSIVFGSQYEHGYEISQEYWGGTLNFTPLNGTNDAWNQPGDRNSTVEYVEDKFHSGKLLFNPGIRFDNVVTVDYTPTVGYFYSTPFAVGNTYNFTEPSVGARYAFNNNLVAYAGFGQSAKPPEISAYYNDVLDQYTGRVAPLVVQPEYSLDMDFGLRGKLHGMDWTVDAYNDRFNNTFSTAPASVAYYIGLGETPAQAQQSAASGAISLTTNAGNARYKGYELSVSHIPLIDAPRNLFGYFNVSQNTADYISSYTSAAGASIAPGVLVPYTPNHLWNFGMYYRGARVSGRLGVHIVGPQQIFDNTTGAPSTVALPTYSVMDGYLSMDLDPSGAYQLELSGTNLLNDQGEVFSYISSAFTDVNGNTVPVQVGMPLGPPSFFLSVTHKMP